MKLTSTKLKELLFGEIEELHGGTPLRGRIESPQLDGSTRYFYWPGNEGLIISMLKRIEKLEEQLEKKTKKK